jgi:hypothetical protein
LLKRETEEQIEQAPSERAAFFISFFLSFTHRAKERVSEREREIHTEVLFVSERRVKAGERERREARERPERGRNGGSQFEGGDYGDDGE